MKISKKKGYIYGGNSPNHISCYRNNKILQYTTKIEKTKGAQPMV